jgi:hypothetical protein
MYFRYIAPLTLRILNINSQERTGFLILLYLLPLLPGGEEACTYSTYRALVRL